jgi:phosphoribosylanthranilate isomerase
MVQVKICGITCLEDALAAVRFGADALGFVFAHSPRQVTPDRVRAIIRKLPVFVTTVGVFVNAPVEQIREIQQFCGLDVVQLHGDESEDMVEQLLPRVIKAVQVRGSITPFQRDSYRGATLLLDTYNPDARGGTGSTFNWGLAVETAMRRPIILAGGLTPENVRQATEAVRPYGVDVSGGVEREPGRKDYEKLERFICGARAVEARA